MTFEGMKDEVLLIVVVIHLSLPTLHVCAKQTSDLHVINVANHEFLD